jgi:hypothetical protein
MREFEDAELKWASVVTALALLVLLGVALGYLFSALD